MTITNSIKKNHKIKKGSIIECFCVSQYLKGCINVTYLSNDFIHMTKVTILFFQPFNLSYKTIFWGTQFSFYNLIFVSHVLIWKELKSTRSLNNNKRLVFNIKSFFNNFNFRLLTFLPDILNKDIRLQHLHLVFLSNFLLKSAISDNITRLIQLNWIAFNLYSNDLIRSELNFIGLKEFRIISANKRVNSQAFYFC